MQQYHGDQDYISVTIPENQRRLFEVEKIQSWRWQCLDGGYHFRTKKHQNPGAGTYIAPETSIMVFHGNPKPSETTDCIVSQHWR
jgi:hypothetical protein